MEGVTRHELGLTPITLVPIPFQKQAKSISKDDNLVHKIPIKKVTAQMTEISTGRCYHTQTIL